MIIKITEYPNNTVWVNTEHIIYWKKRKGIGQGGTDGSYILCTNGVELLVTQSPETLMLRTN